VQRRSCDGYFRRNSESGQRSRRHREPEKAIAALGVAHQQPGDTVSLAAEKTGLGAGTLSQIIEQIGGEGSLTQFAGAIASDPSKIAALFDRDGDGNPLNDVMGMASGLFGKK